MSRIRDTFAELDGRNEGALIAYIMAGDPDPALTPRIAATVARHADIIELGIPFSDPIADGKTIQAAGNRALLAGMTPRRIFEIIATIRKGTDTPLVVMSYYNPILRFGIRRFMREFAGAGGDGIIIPDLPVEEAAEVVREARENEIDTIFLIAPTTLEERIEMICVHSTGFVYLVSLLGVTGAREAVSGVVKPLVQRVVRKRRDIPIAVGFGISKPEHVREIVASGAKGVIVGSAIVDLIAKHQEEPERMLAALDEFCAALKDATKKR
jgi:tryptophan synthase alpha chain